MNKRGLLLVFSGPSGVGKGTVLRALTEEEKNIFYSVSATTRSPREGEVDGVHYFFLSKEAFRENIEQGKMLEYAEYCGNFYGTPAESVEKMRSEGRDVLLEIDACGALQIMEKCPDALTFFLSPPSMDDLRQRLVGRGTESSEVIQSRLEEAVREMSLADHYRYIVVNDSVENAKNVIKQIINKHKNI